MNEKALIKGTGELMISYFKKSGFERKYGCECLLVSGPETLNTMKSLGVTRPDYRLKEPEYKNSSINLIVKETHGSVLTYLTVLCMNKEHLKSLYFWQYKPDTECLVSVSSYYALGQPEGCALTLAFTATLKTFAGTIKGAMILTDAFKSIVDRFDSPFFIECTGSFVMAQRKEMPNRMHISRLTRGTTLIGKTLKSARGAERFAKAIGLKKTMFYNIRTLGSVYTSSNCHVVTRTKKDGEAI